MKIIKKEILGLFLLLFSLLIFISIIGYDITEQPSGLSGPPDSALSYFGVYVGGFQFGLHMKCYLFGFTHPDIYLY